MECRSKSDPKVREFGFGGFTERVHVVERDERIISACVSTRENEWCGEAWARELLKIGKVPFYSHKMENSASANLATRLGLQPVFEEFVISYA